MDLTEFAVDIEKEVEGVWVRYDDKTEFLIAAAGSPLHEKRMRELREPVVKSMAPGQKMDDATADAIVVQGMVDCILLGWKGLKIGGQDLPYSKENAKRALAEPRLKAFRGWVMQQAIKFENFQLHNFETLLGNFVPSSDTTVQ